MSEQQGVRTTFRYPVDLEKLRKADTNVFAHMLQPGAEDAYREMFADSAHAVGVTYQAESVAIHLEQVKRNGGMFGDIDGFDIIISAVITGYEPNPNGVADHDALAAKYGAT